MSGIHVNPENLADLASKIADQPYGLMNRVYQTIDGCQLDGRAFGTIGSAVMGGPYEDHRTQFRQSALDAAGAINQCAVGLDNVAKAYSAAEGFNTSGLGVKYTSTVTAGPGPAGNDGAGSIAVGVAGYALDIAMFPIFAAVNAGITAMSTLCIAVFAAETLWMLTKPDDTEINGAINNWRSAATDAANSEQALKDTIDLLMEDAWPKADGGRAAFDAWLLLLQGDLDQLKTAIGQVPNVMAAAADHIHETNGWLLGIVIGALASMIALTALDWLFGAPEAAKNALGIIFVITVSGVVLSIGAILGTMAMDIGKLLLTYRPQFTGLGSGASQLPDFSSLPATNWQADPPDLSGLSGTPTSGTPGAPAR